MNKILVKVKAEDFVGADYENVTNCPIARALKRQLGSRDVSVIKKRFRALHRLYIIPKSADIKAQGSKPFEFTARKI